MSMSGQSVQLDKPAPKPQPATKPVNSTSVFGQLWYILSMSVWPLGTIGQAGSETQPATKLWEFLIMSVWGVGAIGQGKPASKFSH